MLDAGITPVVHEFGSLGCSGDLAPLAHCALAAMGEGPVRLRDGSLVPAATALADHGIEPVVLAEKEGLALINGTDGMLGMLVLAVTDLRRLVTTADVTAAMSVEGLLGTDDVFAADLHALRPHPGPGGVGRQPADALERQRDPRVAPDRGVHAGAGRILAALCAAGHRRRARHPRPRDPGGRMGAGLGRRQPGRHAGRPRRVERQLPRGSGRLRAGLPRHRRGRPAPASRSGARTGSSTRRAATGCRRSSRTTRASTRG